ncbi:MAG TPA: nicotinate-nucleotide adenylyltransferase [Longimicrobiales bacterium]|nr:nicotinate-nucleotide adenylyltransferase [Longimicrobiales bacterium]
MKRPRVGILGGTFDPLHVGHLIVAQDVLQALDLERILFLPAAQPPHKEGRAVTPARIREEMVRAGVANDPRFEMSDLEIRRGGRSYTVQSLRRLSSFHAQTRFHLIMGVDQFAEFSTWRDPQEVAVLARLVVMTRAGEDPSQVDPGVEVDYEAVPVTRVDVSSTRIRARVREGRPVRYLVPEPVRRIIEREGLYKNG